MAKIVLSLLGAVVFFTSSTQQETNKAALLLEKFKTSHAYVIDFSRSFIAKAGSKKPVDQRKAVKSKEVSVLGTSSMRPDVPSIKLPEDVLDMIWDETNKEGINYYTFLGLIKAESNFDGHTVYHNDNGTSDYGLVQMNSRNVSRLAKEIEVAKIDVFNPQHNVLLGIEELIECRAYWEGEYEGKQLEKAMLLAYNRGRAGSKKWIDNKGIMDSSYTKKVLKYKQQFEHEAQLAQSR
ncbi:transglycosylase SLT domain-containing protein [Paenibacillus sp. UMB4589-SE434]|uniref:transglycosylase SLT domain-containing protein n=1 Tax=Paenibacillus sp. UMB4589-SE434 TaxID=3046314 RepID=UPI002549FFF2|nr:transglycosylase SLT domain-containing protein [Paenibacillus sp. UMB4589-SE434]MDK8179394.1 transglycosylase SLT domain-containing protein [Paenibacillus sp. UMB4589-SE434]